MNESANALSDDILSIPLQCSLSKNHQTTCQLLYVLVNSLTRKIAANSTFAASNTQQRRHVPLSQPLSQSPTNRQRISILDGTSDPSSYLHVTPASIRRSHLDRDDDSRLASTFSILDLSATCSADTYKYDTEQQIRNRRLPKICCLRYRTVRLIKCFN